MKQGSVNILLAVVTSLHKNQDTVIVTTHRVLHLHLTNILKTLFLSCCFFSKTNLQHILFLYISSGPSYPVLSKPLHSLHLSSAFPISNFLSASFYVMPAPHRLSKSACKTRSKAVITTPMRTKKTPSKLVVSAPKKSTGTGGKRYAAPFIIMILSLLLTVCI